MKVKRFPSIARGSFHRNEWVRPPRRGLPIHGQSLRAVSKKTTLQGGLFFVRGRAKIQNKSLLYLDCIKTLVPFPI